MKIVFCCSEMAPFVKTGGLADVAGALPLALEELGVTVIAFLPKYKEIEQHNFSFKSLNKNVSRVTIGKNIQVYLLEQPEFFDRDGLYGDGNGDFQDNLARYQYYCWKSLEVLKQLNIQIDLVHCHDWQSALIPAYLKFRLNDDPFYQKIKSCLTIHNLAYQGVFAKEEFSQLGFEPRLFSADAFEYYDQINFLKAGILFSDKVTTVSPQYARDIQTEKFGCGLEGVLQSRSDKVTGILNGLEYTIWDPQTDIHLSKTFGANDLKGKAENKRQLQKKFNLPERDDVPVFGFVGRLSHQKGFDLLHEAMENILKLNVQLAFLGLGDEQYKNELDHLAKQHPQQIAAHFQFNEPLAHQIYAGSDFFLMPSVFEPCGLSQMISLRYGTIPIVHKTGGLKDTIKPYREGGNGFLFQRYTPEALVAAIQSALKVYEDRAEFGRLVARAFGYDFSWEQSAKQYVDVYNQCLS